MPQPNAGVPGDSAVFVTDTTGIIATLGNELEGVIKNTANSVTVR